MKIRYVCLFVLMLVANLAHANKVLITNPSENHVQISVTKSISTDSQKVTNHLVQIPDNGKLVTTYSVNSSDGNHITDPDVPLCVQISTPALYRDLRVVSVTINHEEFNTATIKGLTVDITTDIMQSGLNEKSSDNPISKSFDTIYQENVSNYNPTRNSCDDLIYFIFPSEIETTIQPLIGWRVRNGYQVHSIPVSTESKTNGWIKEQILSDSATTGLPSFIVLFGDADGLYSLPTYWYEYSTGSAEGDHPYTLLVGDDIVEDAAIGRISFSTDNELITIINKIIGYESMENVPLNWQNHVILESDIDESGISTLTTNNYIKDLMLDYNPNFTFTELIGTNPSVASLTAALNQGASYFNYRGFLGMSDWDAYEAFDLINGPRLPIVTTITCDTGSFGHGLARTEAFLRAGSPQLPAGAVASIGCSTADTHTAPNNLVDASIYEALFEYDVDTIGQALMYAKNQLFTVYATAQPSILEYNFQIFSLMGDPATKVLKGTPEQFTAESSDFNGTGNWSVDLVGLDGAEYFYSLWNANAGVIDSGYDTNSQLSLSTNGVEGEVKLLITAKGFKPIDQNYLVNSSQSIMVAYRSLTADNHELHSILPNLACTFDFALQTSGILEGQYQIAVQLESDTEVIQGYNRVLSLNSNGLATLDSPLSIPAMSRDIMSNPIYLELSTDGAQFPVYRFELLRSYPEIVMTPHFANSGSDKAIWDSITRLSVNISNTDESVILLPHLSGGSNLNGLTYQAVNGREFILDFDFICSRDLNPNISHFIPIEICAEFVTDGGMAFITTTWTEYLEFSIEYPNQQPLYDTSFQYKVISSDRIEFPESMNTDWLELNPALSGVGIDTGLTDTEIEDDEVNLFDLPFEFSWYDSTFNFISICTNGWVSLGFTEQPTYRNWRFPGPLGPQNMLAPFWDDLFTTGGGVFTYYDEPNDRFIVQWDAISRFDNTPEKFQVQLFENGDVLYLYHTVNPVNDWQEYIHGSYFTTGFEGNNSLTGFEYAYNNEYPEGATQLYNGLALLITGEDEQTGELFPGITRIEQFLHTNSELTLELPLTAIGNQVKTRLTLPGDATWLEIVDTNNVTIDAGETHNYLINLSTAGLSEGDYETSIMLNSTDPGYNGFEIPVILHIAESFVWVSNYLQSPLPDLFKSSDGDYTISEYSGLIDLESVFQNPVEDSQYFSLSIDPPNDNIVEIIDNKLYFADDISGIYEVIVTAEASAIPESSSTSDTLMIYCLNNVPNQDDVTPSVGFTLEQNYPNPFNPDTTIRFSLMTGSDVTLEVYNLRGQLVKKLINDYINSGTQSVIWHGEDYNGLSVSSGVYFYKLKAGTYTKTRKMILIK